jgi:two-component system sensor histidine kinase PilS (NtrC family)
MPQRPMIDDSTGVEREPGSVALGPGPAYVGLLSAPPSAVEPAWPTLQTFALVRVLVSTALWLAVMMFGPSLIGRALGADPGRIMSLLGAYFALSVSLLAWTLLRRSRFGLQIWAHLGLDLVLISLLIVLGGGTRSGVFIFYLLPLAEAALTLTSLGAFFVCSLADLVMLGNEVLRALKGEPGEAQLFQAGVVGAALFGITALLRLLSTRLSRQEHLARMRGRELDSQLQINRLVISQMEQGVIVADARTRVRANNRAARTMLGLDPQAQLTGRRLIELGSAQELAHAFVNWLASLDLAAAPAPSDTVIKGGEVKLTGAEQRRLRVRFARPAFGAANEYVIFLEDLQAIEERAQRLKLAAMGRLTASIAHEIRNPLAAIGQAGQLLAEDVRDPLHQRLAAIVRENTQRLNRLVEDVLRAARREPPLADEFDLQRFCSEWLEEFVRDRGLTEGVIRLVAPPALVVRFEQNQLRQVVFNLVDNALRYSSGQPGCIEIRAEPPGENAPARLWVFDDGAGVAAPERDSIFEPFFTTHTRGTGLGLYLAREFCMANGFDLVYAVWQGPGAPSRFGFCLAFGPPERQHDDQPDFMDTLPAT